MLALKRMVQRRSLRWHQFLERNSSSSGEVESGHLNYQAQKSSPMHDVVQEYVDAHDIALRDAGDVIEEFSDELAGMTGKCIDIGCGPGTVTRHLLLPALPSDTRLIGADISKNMLDFAKRFQSDDKRLSYTEFDVETDNILKDHTCAYDNAVSFYCLHWCQNKRKTFENIYQILRPGGRTLVLFMARYPCPDIYMKLSEISTYSPYMKDAAKYVPYFQHCENPRAALKKILKEAGFDVLHCSIREKMFIFESTEKFTRYLRGVNPFGNRMPETIREKFFDELLRELTSERMWFINKTNGMLEEEKIPYRYCVLIAHFKKPDGKK